jgi:UDP-N-acetylmuramate dehydrogenase
VAQPSKQPSSVAQHVPLAPLTTLGLGGRARYLIDASDETEVAAAVAWAGECGLPLVALGDGSNVVVADAGFEGVVLRMGLRGRNVTPDGDRVLIEAAAGEPWDALVSEAVAHGWAGVECLAGIPGRVGATPIQNVGAYGQEVAETIHAVRVFDRRAARVVELSAQACGFGYRDSRFKREPDAYVVLAVTYALRPAGAPTLRYPELAAAIASGVSGRAPTIADVATVVRRLRARKSMVLDAVDPNRRSVGSFFTNPVVTAAEAEAVVGRAVAAGHARAAADVPRFPAPGGRVKLSAGWLIEAAGFAKGTRRGAVGVSSNHALALVHHGGGTTAELVALAREIRAAVASRFGVALVPEPVALGMTWDS